MADNDQHKLFEKPFGAESNYDAGESAIAKLYEAWAMAALFFRTGRHFGHQGEIRAQSLINTHRRIEVFKRQFEKGNTLALLHAVAMCAKENLPLPTWLANAYCESFDSFLRPGCHTSLDEIFHSPTLSTATPAKAAADRQDWQLGGLIWSETWDVAINDESVTSLDAALEKALQNRNFGVKKTKARKLFLMLDNNQAEHLSINTLSRFLEIRRKRFKAK